MTEHKKCTRCKQEKIILEYHRHGLGKRDSRCRCCIREVKRGRQQKWADRKNKYKKQDAVKNRARGAVGDAVRYGKIVKPTVCPECKEEVESKHMQGHHHKGYELKLDVVWLCRWCHAKEHASLIN